MADLLLATGAVLPAQLVVTTGPLEEADRLVDRPEAEDMVVLPAAAEGTMLAFLR